MCMKLLSVLCALTAPHPAQGQTITGAATVQDGDTIYVNHQAIRLWGVDAEELAEPNGARAKFALRDLIGGATVTCVLTGDASYSRSIGRCYIGSVELNQSIISTGYALDCGRYSHGAYRSSEAPGARAKLRQKPYC
jgi:endonuclease YncB( thermonuclease family)